MQKKRRLPLILSTLLALTGCGDDSNPTSGNSNGTNINAGAIQGTYRLKRIDCNGVRISLSGYSESLTINTDGTGSVTSTTSICKAQESFQWNEETGGAIFLESTGVECEQLSDPYHDGLCSMIFHMNGHAIHYECPQSYPMAFGYWLVTKTSTSTLSITRDDECIETYEK